MIGMKNIYLYFDAFSVPDRFIVQDPRYGSTLFDSGFVGDVGQCINIPGLPVEGSGAGAVSINVPKGALRLEVATYSPCDGTSWTYDVYCIPKG